MHFTLRVWGGGAGVAAALLLVACLFAFVGAALPGRSAERLGLVPGAIPPQTVGHYYGTWIAFPSADCGGGLCASNLLSGPRIRVPPCCSPPLPLFYPARIVCQPWAFIAVIWGGTSLYLSFPHWCCFVRWPFFFEGGSGHLAFAPVPHLPTLLPLCDVVGLSWVDLHYRRW